MTNPVNRSINQKRIALMIVVVSVGLAAIALSRAKSSFHRLGAPGLRMVDEPVLDTQGRVVNTNTVALPDTILDLPSRPLPVAVDELGLLPKDTTYGRKRYGAEDSFWVDLSIVLMGTDRTSIHKPEICLTGQDFTIDQSELTSIAITSPHPYDLPIMKLTASKKGSGPNGLQTTYRAIFVYWFVCDGRLTAKHGERMWWMAKDLLTTGVLDRWAYVSYYSICKPGEEATTFERMREAIAASVPTFQLTAGSRSAAQAGFPSGKGG